MDSCPECGQHVMPVEIPAGGQVFRMGVDADPVHMGYTFSGEQLLGRIAVPWENGEAAGEAAFLIGPHHRVEDLAGRGIFNLHNCASARQQGESDLARMDR